jgi:histidinol-phosphate aminotransferase
MDINKLIRENIRTLTAYSSARDDFEEKAEIYLDANENPFNNGINRYPDPYQKKLKERVSELKGLSTQNILLGNGSDEVLDLLFRAFCEPKEDNVISHNPSYGMYPVLAGINHVELRKIDLDKGFSLNAENMLSASDEYTKLFFICSPNNPSGNILAKSEIKKLLDAQRGLVVIDEAYIDFSSTDSWVKELDNYENLIVCQTLSKAWGMAGLRVGMCFASSKIVNVLNGIKPPYNVNELSQGAALKVLNNVSEFETHLDMILKERSNLEEALEELSFIKKVYPSEANFLLVEMENADHVYQYLIENKIVVRNRSKEYLCDNCLRITVGTEKENQRLIDCLKTYKK